MDYQIIIRVTNDTPDVMLVGKFNSSSDYELDMHLVEILRKAGFLSYWWILKVSMVNHQIQIHLSMVTNV